MTAPSTYAHQSQSAQVPMPPPHEKALLNILDNMEELSTLYIQELDAIELRDMQKFSSLQPHKDRLVKDCEIRMSEISRQASLMKTISPALKERVVVAENTLRELAGKSQRACRVRAETMKRVQSRLLEAARHIMMADQKLYNSKGKSSVGKNKPVATAINEAI